MSVVHANSTIQLLNSLTLVYSFVSLTLRYTIGLVLLQLIRRWDL